MEEKTPWSLTGLHGTPRPNGDPNDSSNSTPVAGDPEKVPFQLDANALDTTRESWNLHEHLSYTVKVSEQNGLAALSSKTSVLFRDVRVVGSGAGANYQPHVGAILEAPSKIAHTIKTRGRQPQKEILHGIDGIVKAGEMLLVLGRPGSGCTTMLKTLAGFTAGYVGWSGEVFYNGVDIDVMKKQFRGDILYNAEVDEHFPTLGVGHTISLANEMRAPEKRLEGATRRQYVRNTTDYLATLFGLRHALNTKVGSDYIRGVSGGERKRVSLAEILASRASVAYWDNPTRGLDASTALEFARAIRTLTNLTKNTAVMSLYQAGENITAEFDKVTVLYLGHQVFFGKLQDAKKYFEDLGFVCPPGQTTADFLTAVTDPRGRRVKEGWADKSPRSVDDFVRLWKASHHYAQLQKEMEEYESTYSQPESQLQLYRQYLAAQKAKHQRKQSPYLVGIGMQLGYNIVRAYRRMVGDKAYIGANTFAGIFMALITSSLYYDTPDSTAGFFSKAGAIFFAVLFNALQTMTEVATQYAQRPIVEKHRSYAFYHPFADSLASLFADWPYKFVNVLIFDVILYFMVGLKGEVEAFFIFLLVTYISTLAMSSFFRTLAAVTKEPEGAAAIAGVSVLALVVHTGYIIPKPSMHPWFKWITYIDPIAYAFEALMANEFHATAGPCAQLIPSGPGYENISRENQVCTVTGSRPGEVLVNGDDYIEISFDYSHGNLWRNVGIVAAFLGFFVFTFAVATEFNRPDPGKGEFLIFRKGHEPEHVQKALEEGKAVDDVEAQGTGEVLTAMQTSHSELHGLVQSKDVFTWSNITYDVTLRDGTVRRLLNDITGYVKPGTLTALMGESGAGKTTLLNVLAERVDVGVVGGTALVNGSPVGRSFQRRTGYVQQQDLHLATSTVREALRFSARLRQPKEVPLEEKYEYVERVIKMLEMEDYAEAIIGIPGNGLNVEQRKKTTIGVELVAKPALLLFLDEPTSGLDSQSAWAIVHFLRKLANSGQAILCTIHQPSSVLFEQFDRLLLLKKGGKTVYFGDIGMHSRDVIEYFESNGAASCTDDMNPAEYILDVIGAGATAHVERDWHEVWLQSAEQKRLLAEVPALHEQYSNESISSDGMDPQGDFAESWLNQYKVVQRRIFQHYWRTPSYIVGKLMLNLVAGLLIGFTFYDAGNSPQELQNKLFAIFMSCILAMPLMNQLQPQFFEISKTFLVREKPSKMYHWSTFILSVIVVEIPYNWITGTIFFFPFYYATGFYKTYTFATHERGAYAWLMLMIFEVWFSSFGQAMAALAPNVETAGVFNTLFASFVILFNGVLQPISQLIPFWHWMYHLSPFTYVIGGQMANVVGGVPIICEPKEINIFSPPEGQTCGEFAAGLTSRVGQILNPSATANCEYCRYATGDQYLSSVGMSYDDRWRDFGFVIVYSLFNIVMAFALFYLTKIVSWDFVKNYIVSYTKGRKSKAKGEKAVAPNAVSK